MSLETLKAEAREAVLKYDAKATVEVANRAIAEKVDLIDLIQDGYTKGMTEVGKLFEEKKLFLPHIMASAKALTAATDILTPKLEKSDVKAIEGLGTFLICTIEGDIHSIGKDIVAIMLKVSGLNVINLGRDVPLSQIVKAAKENTPLGIGTSALMTSTMVNQKVLEELLREDGIRDRLFTNVGGAPVTQQWAEEIGADIYTENASDAVAKITGAIRTK